MELRAYVTSPETPAPTVHGDISSSRSLPSLSIPSKTHKRSESKALLREKGGMPEVEEVEALAEWATSGDDKKGLKRQSSLEIPAALRARFGGLEHLMSQRRSKVSLPTLTTTGVLSLDLTHRRLQKLSLDQELRERLRYSKRFEEELQHTEQETYDKLLDLKSQREKYRKTNTFLRAQLFKAELRVREEGNVLGAIPREFKHLFKSSTLKPRDFARSPNAKACSSLHDQSDSTELEEKRDKVLSEVFQNTKRAKELDLLVKQTRGELRAIRSSQVQHYFSTLKEGTDTRNEGLSWVVKALWSLGQKVTIDRFPGFLDPATVEAILSIADLSREQEELQGELTVIARETKGGIVFAQPHSDKWNGVHQRLQGLIKTIRVTSRSEVTSPKLETDLERFQIETRLYENHSKTLEGQVRQLDDAISSLKATEQQRILHECCFAQLEKRLGATMKQMLSALLGTEVVNRQMSILSKEHQSLLDTIERTKTYRFGLHRKVESKEFIP